MRGVICYAQGSPCPTLVLPAMELPESRPALVAALRAVRRAMPPADRDRILKIALVGPAEDPLFELDYQFVQCLPAGGVTEFEFRGSCGHSILAAVAGADRLRLGPTVQPGGAGIRVRVRNNGDDVTCTAQRLAGRDLVFTARFERHRPPALTELLLFGEPVTELSYGSGSVRLSAVSLGNPYVFVDARQVGQPSVRRLFTAGAELFATLSAIRRAAESRLGWAPGAFPKVAALLGMPAGGIAVRAISVPSWHPTLALTGATCLAAAVMIPTTVPARLTGRTGPTGSDRPGAGWAAADPLVVTTPGGRTVVSAAASGPLPGDRLHWVTVTDKLVTILGEVELPVTVPMLAGRV